MQPSAEFLAAASRTPKTAEATFTITAVDVGSEAVRPGHMAELEVENRVLLEACKAVLHRIRSGGIAIGATHEYMLHAAITAAGRR
jgi:hypothetical protein